MATFHHACSTLRASLPLALCLALAEPAACRAAGDGPIGVRVEAVPEGGFRLTRGGEPYFIKGTGYSNGPLSSVAKAGGNSIRTWGAEGLSQLLDEAQANGLTVCAGIWLGHERHGFDYGSTDQVARQLESARQVIERFKNHPALLLWGVGNEMEGRGDNPAVWRAVEEIAAMIHRLDPAHPTVTVISEFGHDPTKIRNLNQHCPSIDIVGVNSYGPVETLAERYRKLGGTKPYIVTEFGPVGWWESPKTAWGAAIEPTSTQKARRYASAYRSSIEGQPLCLGSYAFLWGWKQEVTATWFGLILPDGSRTAAVDVLTAHWTGRPPSNRCPTIESLGPEGSEAIVEPGATIELNLVASDPEKDALTASWELQAEGTPRGGGDAEPDPPKFPDAVLDAEPAGARVKLPAEPGKAYRVFVTVRDGRGGAATANLAIKAKGPSR
jgi:hypothetical protein